MNGTLWTEERDAQLTELRKQGFSAAQIAVKIGGVTRCAVIGRAARLGLEKQRSGARTDLARKSKAVQKPKPPAMRRKLPREPVTAYVSEIGHWPVIDQRSNASITLLNLEPHHCRWPLGESPGIVFCGVAQLGGSSYCAHHFGVSKRGVTTRP